MLAIEVLKSLRFAESWTSRRTVLPYDLHMAAQGRAEYSRSAAFNAAFSLTILKAVYDRAPSGELRANIRSVRVLGRSEFTIQPSTVTHVHIRVTLTEKSPA